MAKRKRQKVMVSERALFARVNRALAKQGETLRRCREDRRDFHNLGRYFVIDVRINGVVGHDVDLETLARDLEVLKAYEALEA